jgi:hypothetical protein
MKTFRWLAIFLLLFASSLTAVAQTNSQGDPPPPSNEYFPKTWVEYKPQGGKFKIKFPQTPRESSETQQGDAGAATVYIAEHKGLLLYVATYADAAAAGATDAKEFLSGISRSWLEANSARNLHVIKNEEIAVAGSPARFLEVETSRDVVRVRWIVVKDRVYYQFVAAPKHQNAMMSENGYQTLAQAFFDSFELTK